MVRTRCSTGAEACRFLDQWAIQVTSGLAVRGYEHAMRCGGRHSRTMNGMPPETMCHRSLGWHAPALRRAVIVASIGLLVALALLPFMTWELAAVGGWDAAARLPPHPLADHYPSAQLAHRATRHA